MRNKYIYSNLPNVINIFLHLLQRKSVKHSTLRLFYTNFYETNIKPFGNTRQKLSTSYDRERDG